MAWWPARALVDLLLLGLGGGPLFLPAAVMREDEGASSGQVRANSRLILRRSAPAFTERTYSRIGRRARRFAEAEPVGQLTVAEWGLLFSPARRRRQEGCSEISVDWAQIDAVIVVPVGDQSVGISAIVRTAGDLRLWLRAGRQTLIASASAHLDASRLQSVG